MNDEDALSPLRGEKVTCTGCAGGVSHTFSPAAGISPADGQSFNVLPLSKKSNDLIPE